MRIYVACLASYNPLVRYFDYKSWARDLQMDMHTVDVSKGVAVFYA